MPDRYNRRACQAAMERLAAAMRRPIGFLAPDPMTGHAVHQPGGWRLDYRGRNEGGVLIVEAGEAMEESAPALVPHRLTARDFCIACDMATAAVSLSRIKPAPAKPEEARES